MSVCTTCGKTVSPSDSLGALCPYCLLYGTLFNSCMHVSCPECKEEFDILDDYTPPVKCHHCGHNFDPDESNSIQLKEDAINRLGRFELLKRVGKGAFGTVWQARDSQLTRIVALKIPRKPFLNQADEDRFIREGRIASKLNHPNIVPVFEIGRENGKPFIVTEFIRGTNLAEWLVENQPDFRQCAEWMCSIAEALDYSHQLGIVHRDLKPANILLESLSDIKVPLTSSKQQSNYSTNTNSSRNPFRPRITDFGMAKRDLGDLTLTLDGDIVGTPVYMSPEQIQASHSVDGRADIYSMGVVFYQMISNDLPFRGSQHSISNQILNDEPKPLHSQNRKIPKDLEVIIFKCLNKSPADRYQTGRELANEIRRWLDGDPIKARPITLPERFVRWCNRRPDLASILGALFFVFLTSFILVAWLWKKADNSYLQYKNISTELEKSLIDVRKHKAKAEDNYEGARKLFNQFYDIMIEENALKTPTINPIRKDILERSQELYKEFLSHNENKDELTEEQAEAYTHIALIDGELGAPNEAIENHRQAITIFEGLLGVKPDETLWLKGLAKNYAHIAVLLANNEDFVEAGIFFDEFLLTEKRLSKLAMLYVDQSDIIHTLPGIAKCGNSPGNQGQALLRFEKIIALGSAISKSFYLSHETSLFKGQSLYYIGLILEQSNNLTGARKKFNSAAQEMNEAMNLAPTGNSIKNENIQNSLGLCYQALARVDFALDKNTETNAIETAHNIQKTLHKNYPTRLNYQANLAETYELFAKIKTKNNDFDSALELCKSALKIRKSIDFFNSTIDSRIHVAKTQIQLLEVQEKIALKIATLHLYNKTSSKSTFSHGQTKQKRRIALFENWITLSNLYNEAEKTIEAELALKQAEKYRF